MSPKVSVVITVYNDAHVVEQAIDSILKQTFESFELILVDNGSTDNTAKVLESYKDHKKVRIVSLKENAQPGGGRNAGAKVAKGDILIFVDADMVFDKDYVKNLVKPVIDGDEIGTFHTKELVANKENIWARTWCINRIPEEAQNQPSGVFRAIKKDLFLKSGGFDPSAGYFDDALGHLGSSAPAPALCYHNNPESLKEAYDHSVWVGKSLMHKGEGSYQKKARVGLLVPPAFVLSVIFTYFINSTVSIVVLLAGVLVYLALLLKKTIPRMGDGYPEFIITVPILWTVRFAGYYIGALKGVMKK